MAKFDIAGHEVEVAEGQVVISSEELAKAIQNGEVSIDSEDEAGWNIICLKASKS